MPVCNTSLLEMDVRDDFYFGTYLPFYHCQVVMDVFDDMD